MDSWIVKGNTSIGSRDLLLNAYPRAWRVHILSVVAAMILQACATPQLAIDVTAAGYGYERIEGQGTQFWHLLYRKNFDRGGDVLHLYLEGDGRPWAMRHVVAADPTPQRPVMLELMSYDTNPSLYLGRPCYHGFSFRPPCEPSYWTMARYSDAVVDSMVAVLASQMEVGRFREVKLFGFSGGATLALLLAERVRGATAVVSLAGNLDVAAWAAHHGYSPLTQSLNPAARAPLPAKVRQLHLMGAMDSVIPPKLVLGWARAQPNAIVRVYEGFDHACCWKTIWPEILSKLEN